MTVAEMKLSYHAQIERMERFQALEEILGFTKVVLTIDSPKENVIYKLTSSGIIIIESKQHKDMVVTAFMATLKQCARLYRQSGKAQIAPKMEKRVRKNAERHAELFEI